MTVQVDQNKFPHCHSGHKYALDVLDGKIPSCKYIKGACRRYIKDIESGKYPFNWEYAERYLRLVQKLSHVNGHWKNNNIIYEPWQNWVWMNIMGFFNPATGFRRYRTAHIEVPRGSSKSTMASQCSLFFLALDNPNGNMIDCTATKRDQARLVLDAARAMASKSDSYRASTGVEVLAHTIVHKRSNSSIQALSSDHSGLDGRASILSVMDELHAMNRATFDVIFSGMSKRRDSLTLCITTAGFNTDGVGHDQSVYAKRVSLEDIEDDQFFAAVYTIDEGDDLFDEVTWRKANPNYGVSVDDITFKAKAIKAKEVPSDLANFKVKHLNIWISEAQAFYDPVKWDQCADPSLRLEDFKGKRCNVGIDISSKIDLTSIAYVFKEDDMYYVFDKSYIPEETVKRVNSTLYDNCISSGHLIQTPGEAIQFNRIKDEIVESSKTFRISEAMYDPWNAVEMSQQLIEKRINMVEFRMTTANLSEPTKTLDVLMRQGKIRHNGSPLLRWAVQNVVAKEDAASNVFPKKSTERLKIDPVIAILMALAGILQRDNKGSVYESRPLRII